MPRENNAREYLAFAVEKVRDNILGLHKAEEDHAKANNREQKKEADRRIKEQHRELLKKQPEENGDSLLSLKPSGLTHYLEATEIADKDGLRTFWQQLLLKNPKAVQANIEIWKIAKLVEVTESVSFRLEDLPPLSFHLSFSFTLAKPYISRDDDPLYILDNPVKKEKIFKLPYVSPSSWKGSLRSAMRMQHGVVEKKDKEGQIYFCDKPEVERLFGIDKNNEERIEAGDFNAGRLRFFPTFFREIGLEIINPHLRATGAGDKPIPFEAAHGKGQFNLLYFPFNLDPTNYDEAATDLKNVIEAVEAMFTVYGFGAKASDGFGVAEKKIDGKLSLRLEKIFEQTDTLEDTPLTLFGGTVSVRQDKKSKQKPSGEKNQQPVIMPISVETFGSFRESKKTKGLIEIAEELEKRIREKGGE